MAKNVRKLQNEIDRSLKQVDEVSYFQVPTISNFYLGHPRAPAAGGPP